MSLKYEPSLEPQMQSPGAAATDRDPTLETLHLVACGLVQQLQTASFTLALPAATKKAAAMVHPHNYTERHPKFFQMDGAEELLNPHHPTLPPNP